MAIRCKGDMGLSPSSLVWDDDVRKQLRGGRTALLVLDGFSLGHASISERVSSLCSWNAVLTHVPQNLYKEST